MSEAWIIDHCRTPRGIGKKGKGALAHLHPQHLGATVLKAMAERNQINTAEVDDIIFGTSSQRGQQGGDLARMAALDTLARGPVAENDQERGHDAACDQITAEIEDHHRHHAIHNEIEHVLRHGSCA